MVGNKAGPLIGSRILSNEQSENGLKFFYVKQFLDIKQYTTGRNMRHITELFICVRPRFSLMIGDDGVDGNADIVKIS